MAIEFVLEGANELKQKLKELDGGREINNLIRRTVKTAAKPVLVQARRLAPVGETGRLRRTLKLRSGKRSKRLISAIVQTGTRAALGISSSAKGYYPAHVALGTKAKGKRAARPAQKFLRGAMDLERADAIRTISRLMGRGIESIARRGVGRQKRGI